MAIKDPADVTTADAPPSLELPTQLGAYYLLDRLASGGTAEVFLAKHRETSGSTRFVAIKKILPYLAEDKEFTDMFANEARIASTLTHENIIKIIEIANEAPNSYIAMEFIRGKDLSKIQRRLSQTGLTLPIPLVAFIISNICQALEYAHHKTDAFGNNLRIVHQDITPRNIIVSYDGQVKVLDFDRAKIKSSGRIFYGEQKGSVGYMSPEQLNGFPLDQRSDIYSVGVLLYELLTDMRMFSSEQNHSSIEQQRRKRIELPSKYNRNISKDLEKVVLRTLAADPEDRYETASTLFKDLVCFLVQDGTPINSENLAVFIRELFAKEIAEENIKFLNLVAT
jgi:serine/threonine protein kinase